MHGLVLSLIAIFVILASYQGENSEVIAILYCASVICWNIDAAVKRLREGGGV